MKKPFNSLKHFTAGLLLTLSSGVFAASVEINTNDNDTAISGYDPVAYFTDSKPTEGKARYTAAYNDAIYQFTSAKNRDLFRANPEKYAPQYGGFCAYGLTKHRKFDVDPTAWRVVDGKLYLNLNEKVQKVWLKDVPGNIESAEEIWPEVKGSTDAYLESVSS
ncbi:MAG: YHS domain-containing protein [Gammaproteobacteria bacterium]|nr:YHS domain-containing protein [Gammaproteobacteria bacterium]